jgi:DNA-directed RNA polymerase specialized sigma24 family protein
LLSEDHILLALRKSGLEQRRGLEAIYKANYGVVEHHVLKNSGSSDDAKDVFQEGIIILCKNIREGKFQGTSTIGTYLFSICRFVWLKMLQHKVRYSDAEMP